MVMLKATVTETVNADDLPPFPPESFNLSAEDEPGGESKECTEKEKDEKEEKKEDENPFKKAMDKVIEEGAGKDLEKKADQAIEELKAKAEKYIDHRDNDLGKLYKKLAKAEKYGGKTDWIEKKIAHLEGQITAAEEQAAKDMRFPKFIKSPAGGGAVGAAFEAAKQLGEGTLFTPKGVANVALAAATSALTGIIVGLVVAETAPIWVSVGVGLAVGAALDFGFQGLKQAADGLPGGKTK